MVKLETPKNTMLVVAVVSAIGTLLGGIGTVLLAIATISSPDPDDQDIQESIEPKLADVDDTNPSVTELRRKLTVTRSYTNDHCSGGKNMAWQVNASEGWTIDPASIEITPAHVSSKSSYNGYELTDTGFVVTGRVRNNGNCVKVLGQTISRDGRGSLAVSGTYDEIRN